MPVARLRPISRRVAALDLHGRFQVATFLVRHERGLALVDAGFPRWEYAVLTAAESLPQPNQITHILLTHAHSDHVGAAAAIARLTGAEIVCSEPERAYIEGRSLARAARGALPRTVLTLNHWLAQRRVPHIRVDRTVTEGELVCGLRPIFVPGHTPGQMALVHDDDGLVLCADALFHVGEEIGHDPIPGLTADLATAEQSMARIAQLGIADVAPSHGPALIGDAPGRIERFLESRMRS